MLSGEHRQYIPDLITGDMDSCSPTVVEKLRIAGSTVIETPDQLYTDYTKALSQIAQYIKKKNINVILEIFLVHYYFKKSILYLIKLNNIFGSWM